MIDILGKRNYFFALSLTIILPGIIFLIVSAVKGDLPLSIDFTGGSLLEVRFNNNQPQPADIHSLYEALGVEDVQVQTTSEGTFVIRSSVLTDEVRSQIESQMEERFGSDVTILRAESVGPTIGHEVTSRAAMAVGVAALAVVIYITFAFRGIANAFRYGVCAIIAMMHDVAVVLSITAIGSLLWGWEMNSMFLVALLTVIGFSVQDKVVVFDRVRENSNIFRRLPYEKLVNHSIVQTLQRSINTQLMTVQFMLLALALFGGITIREFAVILFVGLLSGTYSSIFTAAPLLVVWENKSST